MLVWIDLETTGLDQRNNSILEVGAIVTDDDFNDVARYHSVVAYGEARRIVQVFAGLEALDFKPEDEEYKKSIAALSKRISVSEYVLQMHWTNGLWKDCARSTKWASDVDIELCKFICAHAHSAEHDAKTNTTTQVLPQIAGSTISFDRGFLYEWMPETLKALHYRNLDVSTFNEVARRQWKRLYDERPNNETKAHRGVADIEESIRVLKHYLAHLMTATPL